MSLKSTEKKETNRYVLEVQIEAEEFGKALAKAEIAGMKKIAIPGFRKGKAPKSMVYKMYGDEIFFEDALAEVYPDAVEAAIKESGLELAEQKVDYELVSMDRENGVVLNITVTVMPEVTLPDYSAIEVKRPVVELKDEEIEAEINALRERNARIIPVEDRAAELGDTAVIDYEGFVDGVAFEGGKGEAHPLELGSGQFIPGFEDQIVGHNTGDEFDVNVTFPEEYHSEALSGKAATFKVKVIELKGKELPEADDEFAKDVSEFDTIEEFKKNIGEKILEAKNSQADSDVDNQWLTYLAEGITAEIPECLIEERINSEVIDFEQMLAYRWQGMDLKSYLSIIGQDMNQFRESFREKATMQTKSYLALKEIAKVEKLEASAEEIEAKYDELAKAYTVDVDRVKAAFPENQIVDDIVNKKAYDLMKTKLVVTDAVEEKKPAKKPAAKKTTSTAKKTTTTKKAATEKVAEEGEATEKKPAAKKTTTTKSTATKSSTTAKKTTSTAKKTTTKKAEEVKEESAE